MTDTDLDLVAEVQRLKDREAARDRAEADKLALSPLPIPTKTQSQIDIESAQSPAREWWIGECARKQAHIDAETARLAPAVAKLDKEADVLRAELAALEEQVKKKRDQILAHGFRYPRMTPYVPRVVVQPKGKGHFETVRVPRKRGRR
jgi:hypothetical protein